MSDLEILVTKTGLRVSGDSLRIEVPCDDDRDVVSSLEVIWSEIASTPASRVRFSSEYLGVVVLDTRGDLVHPVLWADDQRSADDAAWCNKKHPPQWWIARIGETPETRHGITKLSWLHRSDPTAWGAMAHICGIADYVRWRSLRSPLADLVITPFTMKAMGWGSASQADPEVLALLDKDLDWTGVVPRLVPDGTVLGNRDGVEIVT